MELDGGHMYLSAAVEAIGDAYATALLTETRPVSPADHVVNPGNVS